MKKVRMGVSEARFADLIWEFEPISSGELSKVSEERLGWKKTTSYTVLKRICDKGIFKNENGAVTSLIPREKYYSDQGEIFVDNAYNGSLPAFVAAFTQKRGLSDEDLDEIRRMLDEYEESKK